MYDFANRNYIGEALALCKRWLENKNNGKTFVDYFHEYDVKSIAVMDGTEIGNIFYNEIKGSDIEIKYFIDRNAEGINNIDGIPVVPFTEVKGMPLVDIIIISPVYAFDEALRFLVDINPQFRVMSMKDAVYEF